MREMTEADWSKLKADLYMRAEAAYVRARALHDMRSEYAARAAEIEAGGQVVDVSTPSPSELAERAAG